MRGFVKLCYLLFVLVAGWFIPCESTNRRLTVAEAVDLTVKVNYTEIDGPGEHLMNDIFAGDTIAIQTFSTQFVQDIAWALNISTARVLVANLTTVDWAHLAPGGGHHSWPAGNVLVAFRLVAPASGDNDLIELVKTLGELIARHVGHETVWPGWSRGGVMQAVDDYWGLVAASWDASLRLWYNVVVVGGELVEQDRYLDMGLHRACEAGARRNATYCDFERKFEDDVAAALAVDPAQVDTVFVKAASADQVLVHFRLLPDQGNANYTFGNTTGVAALMEDLHSQVRNLSSPLYRGNVTVRADPAWGVSGARRGPRRAQPLLGHRVYNPEDADPWHRCRAAHRCALAYTQYNQTARTVNYTSVAFARGAPQAAALAAGFEAWQQGTHGWARAGRDPLGGGASSTGSPYLPGGGGGGDAAPTVRGAHFSPFAFGSLGPVVEAFDLGGNGQQNRGLVLDRAEKRAQVGKQRAFVAALAAKVAWLEENKEVAFQDAETRARVYSKNKAEKEIASQRARLALEAARLADLQASQCRFENSSVWVAANATADEGYWTNSTLNSTTETGYWVNCSACAANSTLYPDYYERNQDCEPCGQWNCKLLFNTSSLEMIGTYNATGYLSTTANGTEVAVYSFDSIELGPEVNVTLVGQRPLVLLSRSSAMINTTFRALSGQLGGFPGGYSVARHADDRLIMPQDRPIRDLLNGSYGLTSNNVNGPGSGNVRLYFFTLQTSADDVDEVQTITTTAQAGQQLRGGFHLHYNGSYTSPLLPHNCTPAAMKDHLERALNLVDPTARQSAQVDRAAAGQYPGVGRVNVSRSGPDAQGGYVWTVSFTSAVGDLPQLAATSLLAGLGARAETATVQDGDSVGGAFSVEFLGAVTRRMAHNISAGDLRAHLLTDLPNLVSAEVTRTDARGRCWDGLCANGPAAGGGLTWTLVLGTEEDNVSPTSPTGGAATEEGAHRALRVNGYLTGSGARVTAEEGAGRSDDAALARLAGAAAPFSLAYGGGGAGHGGAGGRGARAPHAPGQSYNTESIEDLLGGSGGQMGDIEVKEIHQLSVPTGRGGNGGGAIEVVALNDLTIGSKARIIVDAEDGYPALVYGGGGGSGGSVLLAAGGALHVEAGARLAARGGDGGKATSAQGFSGGGGSGGRIALYAQSVSKDGSSIFLDGGQCFVTQKKRDTYTTDCDRHGDSGTLYVSTDFEGLEYKVDRAAGAAGTERSLHLRNRQRAVASSGVSVPQWFGRKGPEYSFEVGRYPGRVSFFAKVKSFGYDTQQTRRDNWGALFVLNGLLDFDTRNTSALIGIGISDHIMYGTNIHYAADDGLYDKRFAEAEPHALMDRWYQFDILIDWTSYTYDVYIDRVLRVDREEFDPEDGVHGVGLYAMPGTEVWYDEIFVGDETTTPTMNFRCPVTTSRGVEMARPAQRGWGRGDLGGPTRRADMRRHAQHVSDRKAYGFDDGGLTPFDGDGRVAFRSDVHSRDTAARAGRLHAGALLYVDAEGEGGGGGFALDDLRAASATRVSAGGAGFWEGSGDGGAAGQGRGGRYYWYGEHDAPAPGTGAAAAHLAGGVHACSTTDFVTWRHEGAVLHYANLTDTVHAPEGPFVAARPKVLRNAATGQWVMWMGLDNANRTLGMAAVAVADHPGGPFHFVRSFYPDGNQTYDQTVMAAPGGRAYLARTYYQDVEYVLPEPLMMPIWESVKDENGSVLFGLNYHRAFYEPEYDNYHDIYLQRWRKEDKPWQVICVNRITGANRTIDPLTDRNLDGSYCTSPDEYKVVEGQGNPWIRSRFKDPTAEVNNQWTPASVPGVRAQDWYHNYLDGTCGIRKLDDDYYLDDPDLVNLNLTDRADCANVADNPLHAALPDKLIGIHTVVETRRAKYVAVSRLTDDFLDTSGELTAFEGELEDEAQLISLLTQLGQFDLSAGDSLGTTFREPEYDATGTFAPARDWNTRFRQYESAPNDRARYSLGCVLDGECPVDFASQLTDGHR